MHQQRRRYYLYLVFAGLCLGYKVAFALEFQPGIGVGAEYTDNARLAPDNEVEDLVAVGFVGASIAENEGPLQYGAAASVNQQHYTQDTFADTRYFNLVLDSEWEMIRERFNWFLRDRFNQRTVNSLDSNTPDNIQDTNVFIFGANILSPITARQSFSLIPEFRQYYYSVQSTDNKQYSLAANWNYLMSQLTNMGLEFGVRKINYTETDIFGNSITGTTYTNLHIIFNGLRSRSDYSIKLGATNVQRENGQDATGFTGYSKWRSDISSKSSFATLLSTDVTDTSRVSQSLSDDPSNGNPADVQITTDVIRNSIFNLAYLRDDALLHSRIWGEFRKLTYSDSSNLNSVVRTYGIDVSYPMTQLLASGAYINYNRTKRVETGRLDQYYIAGGNLKYNFARNLYSSFDIKYRIKQSTVPSAMYDEFSVFASLVYGFGDVGRPTRTGGF